MPRLLIALAGLTLVASCGHDESIPKAQRSAIFEDAVDNRIMSDYRVVSFRPDLGRWRYTALGGQLTLTYLGRSPQQVGPATAECGTLWIDYRSTVAEAAKRILPLARAWARRMCPGESMVLGPPDYKWHKVKIVGIRIIFGPPYETSSPPPPLRRAP